MFTESRYFASLGSSITNQKYVSGRFSFLAGGLLCWREVFGTRFNVCERCTTAFYLTFASVLIYQTSRSSQREYSLSFVGGFLYEVQRPRVLVLLYLILSIFPHLTFRMYLRSP